MSALVHMGIALLVGWIVGYIMGYCADALMAAAKRTEKSRQEEPQAEDTGADMDISMSLYDQEELYPDCTVQVLTNTVTGETSVGWWRNDKGVCPDG
mgnify:CR=1 FL=1